jgi:uncharacterized SAM-binding protein YcdF (DUF218 family)
VANNLNDNYDVIVVLGAPNDASGTLSAVALSRAEKAIAEYGERPGCKLLLTGGFGDRFNTTDKPHAHYVAQHLVRRGVDPGDILDFALSSNTVEDAILVRKILAGHPVDEIRIVTSDFHCRRAELIFRQAFPDRKVVVLASTVPLPPKEQARRLEHEAQALRQIEQQGGVIFPPSIGQGAQVKRSRHGEE